MELSIASHIANRIASDVANHCDRIQVAGSIRRMKPNVKDVEIVAVVSDYDRLYDSLRAHGRFIKPSVPDIIDWEPKRGAKYIRMLLNEEIKLDFFVATPLNWGALLCMRTGSASGPDGNTFNGFIPRMFQRWKKVSGGGKMSNCMPTTPTGEQIAVSEEADFFKLLEVKWVEPVDRIDARAVRSIRST